MPPAGRTALYEQIVAAVSALPGVNGAGLSRITPVSGSGWNGPVELPDGADIPDRQRMSFFNAVTPGWLATYGTALRAGTNCGSCLPELKRMIAQEREKSREKSRAKSRANERTKDSVP